MTDAPESTTPAASRWAWGSASSLIWCRVDRATLLGALITVLVAWVMVVLQAVLTLLQTLGYASLDASIYASVMVDIGFWQPLFYFIFAFAILATSLPIVAESTLPRVLARAAVAGFVGAVGLVAHRVLIILTIPVDGSYDGGSLAVDLWLWPLSTGFGYTALLLVGATIAWLRASRARTTSPIPTSAPSDGNQ